MLQSWSEPMRALRPIIAALLFLVWLPAANVCALVEAFPAGGADPCCETESSAPVPADTCGDCTTLENGFRLSAPAPSVPTLNRGPDAWLTSLFALIASDAVNNSLPVEDSAGHLEPPLWQFVSRTALPARGPSLA